LIDLANIYLMTESFDYSPKVEDSLKAIAAARGVPLAELAYDLLIEKDGRNVFYAPALNFADKNLKAVEAMLKHPNTLFGLGDGGAHVGIICDASGQTFMLQHWANEKTNGHIPIGQVVKKLTHDNARAAHLFDRGVIAAGYRADLNVIDLDRLKLHLPEMR